MKTSLKKLLPAKKWAKEDREQAVLMGLVELYLKTGRAIGSHTLQESGFESLSSATIRNYLSKMEEAGYLAQQHTSGGRVPTEKALRLYADGCKAVVEKAQEEALEAVLGAPSKEPAAMLNRAAETLSDLSKCAVFMSAPRFDHDFIRDVKLVPVGGQKLLAVLITDFGLIRTETIYLEKETDAEFLRTTEEYFFWRMNRGEKPLFRNEAASKAAQKIYNEVMVRHVVGYANFPEEDVVRCGLSRLLTYPEFNDAAALSHSLALLEDQAQMRALLRDAAKKGERTSWIGDELIPYMEKGAECAVIAVPYRINQMIAGSIAILGPMRLPYRNLFGLMESFSEQLSNALTNSVYKFQITFRKPTNVLAKQLEAK